MAKALKDPTQIGQRRTDSRFPLLFTVAFTFVLMFLQFELAFQGIDNRWVDRLFTWRGMEKGDPRIIIVEIDDASHKKVGSFPFKRRVYAQLLDKLFALGVKVVGIDVLFVDPSPSPEDDRMLIEATRRAGGRVVHSVMKDQTVVSQNDFIHPFAALLEATRAEGAVYQPLIDADGAVRRSPLVIGAHPTNEFDWVEDKDRIPSLGMTALTLLTGQPVQHYLDRFGPAIRLNFRGQQEKLLGSHSVNGEVRHIYGTEHGFKQIPIWEVLNDDLSEGDKKLLEGALVLVGSTAIGYFDHYPSPFTESMPGVLVHANLVDNLLHDRNLRRLPIWFTFLFIIAFAALSYQAARHLGPVQAALLVLALAAGWAAASYGLFLKLVEARFTTPVLAIFGPFIVLTVHRVLQVQQSKAELRSMFGQYVAPEVVDILVKDPGALKLGGQYRDMTMFFLDIAHFTTISEKLPPEELIRFLNIYLTALSDNVHRNNGVIDKYIGDCIMAFWNAPLTVEQHRLKACLAAIDCIGTMARLNKEHEFPGMPEKPAARIGLNSGKVTVGNTGSARKLAYTVLGDEVNLASRLEGANKFFGSMVMASENTYAEAKDEVVGRFLGSVRVIGKDIPIKVYELLARKGQASKEWEAALPVYHAGLDRFLEGKFEEAKKGFARVLELIPGDNPAQFYRDRCDDYIVIPPQDERYKVINLQTK